MAHWAIALAAGPHINYPVVPPAAAELAWKELGLARARAANASAVERDLIEALGHRYATPNLPTARGSIALTRTRCATCGRRIRTIRMSARFSRKP